MIFNKFRWKYKLFRLILIFLLDKSRVQLNQDEHTLFIHSMAPKNVKDHLLGFFQISQPFLDIIAFAIFAFGNQHVQLSLKKHLRKLKKNVQNRGKNKKLISSKYWWSLFHMRKRSPLLYKIKNKVWWWWS